MSYQFLNNDVAESEQQLKNNHRMKYNLFHFPLLVTMGFLSLAGIEF